MRPYKIINTLVLSLVILAMSIMINLILPKIQNDNYEIIASVVSAAGLYVILTSLLNYVFNKIRFFKKILLKNRFLEGTWIGTFEGKNGDKRMLVEIFTQSLEDLQITGESFDLNGKVLGRWKSETVTIDTKSMTLIYSYQCEILTQKESYTGIAKFNIHSSGNFWSPNVLRGYSTDIIDGRRQNSIESKLNDKQTDIEEAFEKAKEKYK